MPLTDFLIIWIPCTPVASLDAQTFGSMQLSALAELASASLISHSPAASLGRSKSRGIKVSLPTVTKAKNRSLYSRTSHSAPDGNEMSYVGGPYLVEW
jgi:hypothetical protein